MRPGSQASFRSRYPDIELDLGVSDRRIDLIGDGVDCVIRGGDMADTTLVARRIANLDYVTCASPLYLKARGTPKHPSDLVAKEPVPQDTTRVPGHALVGYFLSTTSKPLPLHFHRDDEHHVIQGQTVVAVNESTAHMTALLSGLGIGQSLGFMARPHIESGTLQPLLSDWGRPRQSIHLVYPSNRHLNAKARMFADWVTEVLAPYND